tara:strand:- start:945 stop:1181 length:237 start_codon:yes stop_codon:yes gene_type:complete
VPAEVKFVYKVGDLVFRKHYPERVGIITSHSAIDNSLRVSGLPLLPAYSIHWLTKMDRYDLPGIIPEKYLTAFEKNTK